jgi:protoheme ferro-lyase
MDISESRILPEITRTKGTPGLGHTAVIVLAHGEPETYDPSAWIKQIKELDEQKVAFIPYAIRPIFFNKLREKYLMAGKSGHNFECLQITELMEAEYRKKGDTRTKFYISYLENEPHPDTAVIQALNEGASSIILCNLFITISNHTKEGLDMINVIKLEDYNVKLKYTKPLYDSKTLQELYINKVISSVSSTDKNKTGIVLVGHGQPPEWDKEFYTETQQENSFRQDILKQLESNGYKPQNLKLAWMEFRDPEPKEAINQLIKNGATNIFYFSTIIGSESIHAKYDVPEKVQQAQIPDSVKLQQLTAFEDKTGIVKALIERIGEQQ